MKGKKIIKAFITKLINKKHWPTVDLKTYNEVINTIKSEKERIIEKLYETVRKEIQNKQYRLNYLACSNNKHTNIETNMQQISQEIYLLYDTKVTKFIENLMQILIDFIIFDYYERGKKNWKSHIFKDRPRKKANFGQQYCTEGTTFSRVELILRDFSSPDTKVLFVGDGDLCSLALKSKVDFEIHMLDIDREIIRFIENKNTGIITHKINLAKGVPKELHNYFDAIMLDPFWDIKGAEMFINPACECIKKNKLSRIYVCICPLVIGDNYWTLQKMILNKGLVFHEIIKHFNWYELNTDGAYNQVLDIFSDINRKYFKSDLLNNSLNIPYATSDMHILGFL